MSPGASLCGRTHPLHWNGHCDTSPMAEVGHPAPDFPTTCASLLCLGLQNALQVVFNSASYPSNPHYPSYVEYPPHMFSQSKKHHCQGYNLLKGRRGHPQLSTSFFLHILWKQKRQVEVYRFWSKTLSFFETLDSSRIFIRCITFLPSFHSWRFTQISCCFPSAGNLSEGPLEPVSVGLHLTGRRCWPGGPEALRSFIYLRVFFFWNNFGDFWFKNSHLSIFVIETMFEMFDSNSWKFILIWAVDH